MSRRVADGHGARLARRRLLQLGAALPLALGACRFPRDPGETLARVTGGTMEVGVLDSAPLALWNESEPEGAEVDLVKGFAESLGARPSWHRRRDMALREALERGAIDLLIGGLVEDDPWSGRIALTRPYLIEDVMVAGRSGRTLDSLEDLSIAVENDHLAGLVIDAGGVPVAPDDQAAAGRAASVWRVPRDDEPAGAILLTRHHVMAVRPGENAWLLALERHLRGPAGRTARVALNIPAGT